MFVLENRRQGESFDEDVPSSPRGSGYSSNIAPGSQQYMQPLQFRAAPQSREVKTRKIF